MLRPGQTPVLGQKGLGGVSKRGFSPSSITACGQTDEGEEDHPCQNFSTESIDISPKIKYVRTGLGDAQAEGDVFVHVQVREKDMQNELKRIQQAMEITFVYVTHDQEEALAMSDTVVVIAPFFKALQIDKTTTLRIIGGFQTPTSGDVLFDGVRINAVPPHKRTITGGSTPWTCILPHF